MHSDACRQGWVSMEKKHYGAAERKKIARKYRMIKVTDIQE
jgi:hypothetical protein